MARTRIGLGLVLALALVIGTSTAARADTYCKTKYPVVLAHGMAGFQSLFGVFEYWYGITSSLGSCGAQVYVTSVSAFNSSEARGEQLLSQIEYIAAASGAGKVNLIAHSQGGLDARYVMAVRPDLLASVTTVGTPHKGAALADFIVANVGDDGSFGSQALAFLANSLGELLELLAGTPHPQDAIPAAKELSTAGAAAFTARYPAGVPAAACGAGPASWNGVRLYSWTGSGVLTNLLDLGDAAFGVASLLYSGGSDGLVGRCSAHFGTVLRDDYRMNHLDEVNQLFGLVALFESSPVSVFRAHVNRLRNAGL